MIENKLPVRPIVKLVSHIASPYDLSVATARTCYSGKGIIWPDEVSRDEKAISLRDRIAASTLEAGHLTERFSRSIEQLGSREIHIRTGAIYSLQSVADNCGEDYEWPIIQLLSAFLRDRTKEIDNINSINPLDIDSDLAAAAKVTCGMIRNREFFRDGGSYAVVGHR